MTNEHSRAADHRDRFGDLVFDVDDLLLLEPFQILYLEQRVPRAELGELLRGHRHVGRYLRRACPAAAPWLQRAIDAPPTGTTLEECEQRVLWEIADLIVYNKAPHAYDALPHHRWDFEAVTSVAALAGTVVLDVGAGTGQTAVELSRRARSVFAIEPVGRLRQFIRERARRRKRGNLYVIDGMAHAIPLPSQFADVVVSVRALSHRGCSEGVGGWRFDDEVAELERVVRPGGTIVVCAGWLHDEASDRPEHHTLVSPRWGYHHDAYAGYTGQLSRYHKQF